MKNITKLFAGVICLMIMVTLTVGCGGTSGSKSKGKCEVFECVEKINTEGTIDDINKLIGFDGKVTSQSEAGSSYSWKLYRWDLTEDDAIEVRYNDSLNTISVEAIYSRDSLKNKKVNFSNVKTEMKAINSKDGLKFEDVKKIVGGVDGNLVKKDSTTLTYTWYNAEGGSFTARFSTSSGKCTSYNGVF